MQLLYSALFLTIVMGVSCEDLTPLKKEEYCLEGTPVTLSYNYSRRATAGDEFYWYRQDTEQRPEFLLYILGSGFIKKADPLNARLSSKLNEGKNRLDLEISSADMTDSALYYCAVRPAGAAYKIIFGTGTKVIVNSREKHEPSYYTLNSSNTTACLATDFSAHKANSNSEVFNNTEATRVKGDSYYSQVALEKNCTKEDGSEKCEANWYFDTDAKINFLSLTILGLRILFLKTIVFNVLMTLRLWMS